MSSIYPTISHIILIYYCVELILPSVRFLFDLYTSQTLTCNPKHRCLMESFFLIIGSHWTHRRPQSAAFPPAILFVSLIILSNPSILSSTHSTPTRRKILSGNMPDSCPEIITDWTYIPLTKANEKSKLTQTCSMTWNIFHLSASPHRSFLDHLR